MTVTMVEILAQGDVHTFRTARRRPIRTGAADGSATTTLQRTERVKLHIEFPEGHVNLEAYAPDSYGLPLREQFGRYIEDVLPEDVEDYEVDTETWDVQIRGTKDEWAKAADTWLAERPDVTYKEALERFKGWQETGETSINKAIWGE